MWHFVKREHTEGDRNAHIRVPLPGLRISYRKTGRHRCFPPGIALSLLWGPTSGQGSLRSLLFARRAPNAVEPHLLWTDGEVRKPTLFDGWCLQKKNLTFSTRAS